MTIRTTFKNTLPSYRPRVGYCGWICSACGSKADRDRFIPAAFVCQRPVCDNQYAEWVDEVQS